MPVGSTRSHKITSSRALGALKTRSENTPRSPGVARHPGGSSPPPEKRRCKAHSSQTSAWAHKYTTRRLMHRLGRRPPAEAATEYCAQQPIGQHTDHTYRGVHKPGILQSTGVGLAGHRPAPPAPALGYASCWGAGFGQWVQSSGTTGIGGASPGTRTISYSSVQRHRLKPRRYGRQLVVVAHLR